MPTRSTTIRLDATLHKTIQSEARRRGLSFSDVVHILLHEFASGKIQIEVKQYPAHGPGPVR